MGRKIEKNKEYGIGVGLSRIYLVTRGSWSCGQFDKKKRKTGDISGGFLLAPQRALREFTSASLSFSFSLLFFFLIFPWSFLPRSRSRSRCSGCGEPRRTSNCCGAKWNGFHLYHRDTAKPQTSDPCGPLFSEPRIMYEVLENSRRYQVLRRKTYSDLLIFFYRTLEDLLFFFFLLN